MSIFSPIKMSSLWWLKHHGLDMEYRCWSLFRIKNLNDCRSCKKSAINANSIRGCSATSYFRMSNQTFTAEIQSPRSSCISPCQSWSNQQFQTSWRTQTQVLQYCFWSTAWFRTHFSAWKSHHRIWIRSFSRNPAFLDDCSWLMDASIQALEAPVSASLQPGLLWWTDPNWWLTPWLVRRTRC